MQSSAKFLVRNGGTPIGGGYDATLTATRQSINVEDRSDFWDAVRKGVLEWQLQHRGRLVEAGTRLTGEGLIVSAALKGNALAQVEAVTRAQVSISNNFERTANTDIAAYARQIQVVSSTYGLTFDIDYSKSAAQQQMLFDALLSGDEVDWQVEVGAGIAFSGTGFVQTMPLSTPNRSHATQSLTLTPNGPIGYAGADVEAGLAGVIAAMLADPPTRLSADLQLDVTGPVTWGGFAYPTALNVNIPHEGAVDVDLTLSGDGTLTRS